MRRHRFTLFGWAMAALVAGCGSDKEKNDGAGGSTSAGGDAATGLGGLAGASNAMGGTVNGHGGASSGHGGGTNAAGGAVTSASGGAGAAGGPTAAVCTKAPGGGSSTVQKPELIKTLFDRWHEAWLGSPAVADLDGDGVNEIVVPRHDLLMIWHLDGTLVKKQQLPGRIWAPPVVADLVPSRPGLEVAVASRQQIAAWDAAGNALPGFPVTFRDEMRSLAAEDIDGDGSLELVAVTTSDLKQGGRTDILIAYHNDGSVVAGFPPNTTGASGCDDACYVHAGFDQNIALGDVDGDGIADLLAPQDNAYVSLHHGTGVAFNAASIFRGRTKFLGIRFLLDYALAQQGYADDEEASNQAHFTDTAPAIVDVDGDGKNELVMVSSVQNAAQTDRERGVALWVVRNDGTRPAAWVKPFHAPNFIDGLWDPGDNIVATTNQVTVADIDAASRGFEFIFAGFDGKLHAVSSDNRELWSYSFTTSKAVLTGGVVAADLSGDGIPELVFNTYSTAADASALYVLGADGKLLHRVALPDRGAMPVPTIADVDGDGDLEIVVSLKDGVDKMRQVFVYSVAGSSTNCMPWPTGRGNLRRTGFVASP
ncbi:MAG TPA: VCBS repeat-containing protein [Polyangiaceae bacterium]|nr:VCBS repeat-containing protein [Polyangiaceae bacterium]